MVNRRERYCRPSRVLCLEWGDRHVLASDDEQGAIVRPSLRQLLRNASGGHDARDTSDRCDKVKHGRTALVVTRLGLANVRISNPKAYRARISTASCEDGQKHGLQNELVYRQ